MLPLIVMVDRAAATAGFALDTRATAAVNAAAAAAGSALIVAVITSQADVPAPPALAGVMRKEMTDELAWSMRPKSAAADAADVILMVTEGPRCSMAASASVSACKTAGSCRAASDTPLMVIVTVTADCAATDGVTIKLDDIESEGEDGTILSI